MQAVLAVLILCSLAAAASAGLLLEFTEHPLSQEVAIGDDVTLQCSISTAGATVSHWLFNGNQLSPGPSIDISGNSLTIQSFQTSHAGDYRCAGNAGTAGYFQLSHIATLTYFGQRSFIAHPEDFTVYLTPITAEGTQPSRETAALQCEIERVLNGNLPVITWELRTGGEGSAVTALPQGYDEDTSRAVFQYDHIGYFQLFFPIEESDGTEVRCVAAGPGGQIIRSNWATITISDQQTPLNFPVFSLRAPEVVHFIGDQDLVLGCSKTTANDSLGIRWIQNLGNPIYTQGFPISVFALPDGITLLGPTNIVLNASMREDFQGSVFRCRVRIPDFEPATANTNITVPPTVPPIVYMDISGGDVTLRYTFSATIVLPTPYTGEIQWYFNGVAVDTSESKYTLNFSDGSLTISDVTFDDEGIYQAELLEASPSQLVNFLGSVDGGECLAGTDTCGSNTNCSLTESSFSCACMPGFTGDPFVDCVDIDECVQNIDNCGENADCINTVGSFACACEAGYSGDGINCVDIDECEQNTDNCNENADCDNTEGGFVCTCVDGYNGNGVNCVDIDECVQEDHNCDVNALCVNTPGGFGCTCNDGFTGNGINCDDIDECEQDTNNCNENAECDNRVGSFLCTCEEDYTGNGIDCELRGDGGLKGWEIALIVIFLILGLLCCYFLFCFLCLFWRKRWRNYYAEEKEKKYHEFRVELEEETYTEKKTVV